MGTTAIVGDPESAKGSGKTATMAFLQYLDWISGRRIISNVEYEFPYEKLNFMEIIEDLESGDPKGKLKYKNCSIGIDEIHLALPSGMAIGHVMETTLIVNFLLQSRKLGIDVYFTVHREMNVNNKVRNQIERSFMAIKYHIDDDSHCTLDRCDKPHYIEVRNVTNEYDYFNSEIITINPAVVGQLYDTNQLLDILPEKYFGAEKDKPLSINQKTGKIFEDRIEKLEKALLGKVDESSKIIKMSRKERIALDNDELKNEPGYIETEEDKKRNIEIKQLEREIEDLDNPNSHRLDEEQKIIEKRKEDKIIEGVAKGRFQTFPSKKKIIRINKDEYGIKRISS